MAVQGEDSIDIERQAYLEMHPILMTEYLGHPHHDRSESDDRS